MTEQSRLITKEEWDEYNLLKAKLNLAINALKEIKSMTFDRYLMNDGWLAVGVMREQVRKVLKQIGDEE